MNLTPSARKFILHWGQMGTRWGINRTVAQIHALLYISPRPLHAEEIAETLSVARSNVSTSLRELQAWRVVEVAPVLGDRRDHYTSHTDVWEMFSRILEERKRREIDPTLALLRTCVAEAEQEGDAHVQTRLSEILSFMETMSGWYAQMQRLPRSVLLKLFKLGDKVQTLLTATADGRK